jgi:ribA/ribD-fused uncharacterized protein
MKDRVWRFSGEYREFSNFYPSPVLLDGVWYDTVEHAYQASKTTDPELREIIRKAKTPGKAKQLGKVIVKRPDWYKVNIQIMLDLLVQKFTLYPDLKLKLLSTGSMKLIEGNTWCDNFWGDCICGKCKYIPGLNHLGELLMDVRFLIGG